MSSVVHFFFFNDTATTEIYTLSLHDALPISLKLEGSTTLTRAGGIPRSGTARRCAWVPPWVPCERSRPLPASLPKRSDRKSTRLNSSHANISYAVFCLKKKKNSQHQHTLTFN